MQFQVRLTPEYTLFYLDAQVKEYILLQENISSAQFSTLLQATLDKIKPLIIISSLEHFPNEKLMNEMSRHHFFAPNEHVIYLNFSIRNQLNKNVFSSDKVSSFELMHADLVKFFAKK